MSVTLHAASLWLAIVLALVILIVFSLVFYGINAEASETVTMHLRKYTLPCGNRIAIASDDHWTVATIYGESGSLLLDRRYFHLKEWGTMATVVYYNQEREATETFVAQDRKREVWK